MPTQSANSAVTLRINRDLLGYLKPGAGYLRLGQMLGLKEGAEQAAGLNAATVAMFREVNVLGFFDDITGFLADFNREFGLSARKVLVGKGLEIAGGLTVQHPSKRRSLASLLQPGTKEALRKAIAADQEVYDTALELVARRRKASLSLNN